MFATRRNAMFQKPQEQLPGGPRPIPGVPEQWLPPVMKEADGSRPSIEVLQEWFLKSEMLKSRTNNGFRHKYHNLDQN